MSDARRILLVDDDATLLRAVARSLGDLFDLETAESAFEAIELMESGGPFPVLVSDVKMPKMDGVELVQLVQERWPKTVCIVLTGNQDEETAKRATQVAGVCRILNKPSPREELVEAISEAFKIHQSQDAIRSL